MRYLKLLFFVFSVSVFSQDIIFQKAPENFQLYARDASNTANVVLSGKVEDKDSFEKYVLKVFKDDKLYDCQKHKLKNNEFLFNVKIKAGLYQYKFELYAKHKKEEVLCFTAKNIVCGDAYIITGQSNSHASSTLSTFNSPYCRSFGVKTGYETYSDSDKETRWGLATGNCVGLKKKIGGWFIKNPLGVGVWGMELMKILVEKHQIPVCIINGGSGSSTIEKNMKNIKKPVLETSFGRLAYRVEQAGLRDKIKAILWHQGESNSNKEKSYKSYAANFDILIKDWQKEYTNLEKVYLFQLHPGCGKDSKSYHAELREVQNKLAQKYAMVEIMSTMGVTGHDGCHFSYEGYLEFAKRIRPLLSRDFYNEKFKVEIVAPALIEAKYIAPKQIELIFNQELFLQKEKKVRGITYFLKDQFFLSNKLGEAYEEEVVESISAMDNKLVLTLKNSIAYKYITYLPGKFYTSTTVMYKGPWLFGKENKIGALSFYQRPIILSSLKQ